MGGIALMDMRTVVQVVGGCVLGWVDTGVSYGTCVGVFWDGSAVCLYVWGYGPYVCAVVQFWLWWFLSRVGSWCVSLMRERTSNEFEVLNAIL